MASQKRKGLLGYYKQFEGLTEDEINADLREAAAERRAKALAIQDPLDLSRTTWPEYPHPAIVNAITFAARRGLHRYLDRSSGELRSELAHRHGVAEARLVVGDGIAQLISEAAAALLEPDDELITPWPSYPLYPVVARHARGVAVPVAGFGVDAILSAVNDRTRLVALCNPNDPTGELMGVDELRSLLGALPERVVVLLDEA
ncbi:MAG TPA: aminotransferase class I/II-fold pyridoxal phosphate-dependent enzyme, partial [Baekduia sp.]|nr:aminotransferase class I/II-fold pyridoxal phosphate-dependent enzyme [Baekduia sp.]